MPVAREAWQRSTLKCLFPSEAEALEAATLILSQDWATDIHVQGIQPVDEQDWVRLSAVPVQACAHHRQLLDRADLARDPP